MADLEDYQIWIERVDGSGTIGFVLEDGHIKSQDMNTGYQKKEPDGAAPMADQKLI